MHSTSISMAKVLPAASGSDAISTPTSQFMQILIRDISFRIRLLK